MKSRKLGALLAMSMVTALMMGSGLVASATRGGADDDSPLHMLMEKVQSNNATVLKGVRTAANFKKSQADVVTSAKELSKLAKEARKFTEPATDQKQPQAKWEELTDAMIKESDKFVELAAKTDAVQVDVKNAYKSVQKSCTDCHDVFRVEE